MLYFIWNRWEIHLYWKYRKLLKYSKRSQFSRFPDVTVYWNLIFCIGFLLVYNSSQTLTRCLTLSQKTPSNFSKLNPSLVKLVWFRTNLMESIQNKYVRILGTTEWLNSSENKFISMPVVKIDFIQIVLSSNCWWNIASLAQLCSTSIWSIVKSQQFTDLTTEASD